MIHQFTINNTHMVLDVNTGAFHVLDEKASRVLSAYGQNGTPKEDRLEKIKSHYGAQTVEEIQSEFEQLKKEGTLFSEDPYEALFAHQDSPVVVKALCLHIAHDCNMRCKYCFAGEGHYNLEKSKMSIEVGKKSIDFVIAHSGNRRNIEIDFFGGEPLLNMETVKAVVDYAKEKEEKYRKHFRFTITTNGLLLNDDLMEYLNRTMDNIVLSLDGRKKVNDFTRVRRDGSGSYDAIVPKFQKMTAMRQEKDYYVRGTFTAKNLDFSQDVLHMAELGFEQLSIEPVVLPEGSDMEIKEEHLEAIGKEYEKLAMALYNRKKEGKGVNFFHFMIDLEGGPCVAKRLRGCGSGTEYLAVTPQGDLYPCHQFVGTPQFLMGDVFNGIKWQDIAKTFQGINVYTKEKCRACWAKFYCSGGCTANAWNSHQNLKECYDIGCVMQKKRTECALWLKAMEMIDAQG